MSLATIVYIEDDQENYDLVCRVLEATRHYRVLQATDGATGIELVQRERPALVLVDLDIPVLNGFEVTRRIKQDPTLAGIPIAAVSAHILKSERDRAIEAGCITFIEKPFDIGAFRDVIGRLLAT